MWAFHPLFYLWTAFQKEESSMKFGHFDDERREYVIDTPKTPLP